MSYFRKSCKKKSNQKSCKRKRNPKSYKKKGIKIYGGTNVELNHRGDLITDNGEVMMDVDTFIQLLASEAQSLHTLGIRNHKKLNQSDKLNIFTHELYNEFKKNPIYFDSDANQLYIVYFNDGDLTVNGELIKDVETAIRLLAGQAATLPPLEIQNPIHQNQSDKFHIFLQRLTRGLSRNPTRSNLVTTSRQVKYDNFLKSANLLNSIYPSALAREPVTQSTLYNDQVKYDNFLNSIYPAALAREPVPPSISRSSRSRSSRPQSAMSSITDESFKSQPNHTHKLTINIPKMTEEKEKELLSSSSSHLYMPNLDKPRLPLPHTDKNGNYVFDKPINPLTI